MLLEAFTFFSKSQSILINISALVVLHPISISASKSKAYLTLVFSFLNFGDQLGELLSDVVVHLLSSLTDAVHEDPNLPTDFQEVL